MEKQCTTHSLRGWDPAPDVSAGCTYVKFPDALQRNTLFPLHLSPKSLGRLAPNTKSHGRVCRKRAEAARTHALPLHLKVIAANGLCLEHTTLQPGPQLPGRGSGVGEATSHGERGTRRDYKT